MAQTQVTRIIKNNKNQCNQSSQWLEQVYQGFWGFFSLQAPDCQSHLLSKWQFLHIRFLVIEKLAGVDQPFDNYLSGNLGLEQIVRRGMWPQQNAPAAQQREQTPMGVERPVLADIQNVQDIPPLDNNEGELKSITSLQTSQTKRKFKKLKCGVLNKPDTDVRQKEKFPHMSQNKFFVHKFIAFDKLNFKCFVAGGSKNYWEGSQPARGPGETQIITEGCILEGRGTLTLRPLAAQKSSKTDKTEKNAKDEIWFCKDYNQGECTESSPHSFTFRGTTKQVWHICKKCWKEKKERNGHPASSEECPLAQA